MGVPTVSATSPEDGDTNVDTRKVITITFSEAVDTSTINEGTVVLMDLETFETLQGSFSFSSSDTVVSFLPEKEFDSNKRYKLSVIGAADALPGGNVKSSTSDSLASTYTVTFRVETERFVSLSEITDRNDIDHVAPIREESELAASTGDVLITATSPAGFSTNNTSLSTITVTFSEAIDSDAFDADTMFSMEMSPLLFSEDYYGNYDSDSSKALYLQDNDLPITLPSGSVSVSSNVLTWTRYEPTIGDGDHPQLNTFPFNAQVIVTIDSTLAGTSGNTVGEDVKVAFTTEYFPLLSNANTLRLDAGTAVDDLYDDTLNRTILGRSISAWQLACKGFSLTSPTWAAINFVRFGSLLDIIETASVDAELKRGIRKQIGDLRVDYSYRTFARDTGKLKTARQELEKSERVLIKSCASLRVRSVNLMANSPNSQVIFRGIRNWDSLVTKDYAQKYLPTANTPASRRAKNLIDQGARATAYVPTDPVDNGYVYIYEV